MFKRYQIVYFALSHTKPPRGLCISLFPVVLLLLLLVTAFAGTIFAQVYINTADNTQPIVRENSPMPGEHAARFTDNIINSAVTALQNNDKFAEELFSSPIVANNYEYSELAEKNTDTGTLANMHTANSRISYADLHSLSRLISLLNTEFDLRNGIYLNLEEFLEEQYVIYRHTPSIWPSPTHRQTSNFGFRRSPFTGIPTYHEGADFSAPTGTRIAATADGIVVYAGTRTGYGYLVTIDHGFGYMTRYAHNSRLLVKVGDRVQRGDIISLSGATGRSAGAHLHYEVLYNGTPMNSKKFLPDQ